MIGPKRFGGLTWQQWAELNQKGPVMEALRLVLPLLPAPTRSSCRGVSSAGKDPRSPRSAQLETLPWLQTEAQGRDTT